MVVSAMSDLMMNKTRHCPYCPVAAGDDNFMWQHISDHLENQHKNPQFKPVPLPTHVVPKAQDTIVGKQVPMDSQAQVEALKERVGVETHEKFAKNTSSGDISTEKLLAEEIFKDGKSNKSDEGGDKVSTDELLNNDLGDEDISTEKLLSNYLNAKELTTEELLNKDLIAEEKSEDANNEDVSDAQLLNNDLAGRELTDEELLNLHVNDEEISNEELLNNDLSGDENDFEESVMNSPSNNYGQNNIPCGEDSSNEAETGLITSNVADTVNDTEERSSKRKAKKPRKGAPKHINDVLSNPDSNQAMAHDEVSNATSTEKEGEETSTSEVDAEAQIKQETGIEVNQRIELDQKVEVKKPRAKGKGKIQRKNKIEQKVEQEVKREPDIDVNKKEVKKKLKVDTEVKREEDMDIDADTSRNDKEDELPLEENTSTVYKLSYMSNPTPDQIKKCLSPQYECPVCSETYQDFGGHMSLSHGLVRCGRDRACNTFFETMEGRRRHEASVHGTANTPTTWKIICGHCKDVKFPDIFTVVEHRHSLHSFHTCTLCSMITTKDEYYQIHMKSHSIRNASIINLKQGKSLLENLLTYPIATLNQDSMSATCNLCSPGLQAHFDVRGGGDKLWDHFKTGHKVKNPAEALLRLFNGKQFHFRTLLNDKQRLRQLEEETKAAEEAAAKEAEAVAAKEREAAAKKLEAAEKEREAAAARKREAEAKEREVMAKKMEAAAKEKEAAAARKRETEAKKAEAAAKEREIAAAKKEEAEAKERETAIKKMETASKEGEATKKKSNRKSVPPAKQVNSKAPSDASKVDPKELMKTVVLGSSVSIQLKSKAKTQQAEIKNIGTNENSSINDNNVNLKTSPVKIKSEPEQSEVVAVKVVENKRKRKRTVTKKLSSVDSSNVSYSSLNVKQEILPEDSKEIKTEGGTDNTTTEEPKQTEDLGGLVEASSDTHSPEASLATIFIKAGAPYTCEVCKDQFSDNGDHLCFQHGMLKCASAKNCQAFFGASVEKEKHEKDAHVDTFSCMPCKMKFNNVYSQLEHRNSGHSQLTCMFCFVGFKCQEKEFSYFKSHMKTHKIAPSLLNDNDERNLFEKLLGEPIVQFNRETMSVTCNLCVKTQSFSGVMSVKEGGNLLWEHFKVIHKIKNSNEMLHLFNGSGFCFSNRKLKYTANLDTFVKKESTVVPANANKSQMKSEPKSIVKEETSYLKKSSPETSDIKEKATKTKRGRPKIVKMEKVASEKLEHDEGLDDLYGKPPAKKSKINSNVKISEQAEESKSFDKEIVKEEVGVKEELPVEQVMAAIDHLQEELKPKKKRHRRSKKEIEEDLKRKEAEPKKKRGRQAKAVPIKQVEELSSEQVEEASSEHPQSIEMMDDLEENEELKLQISNIEMMDDLEEDEGLKLQISKVAEKQEAYEEFYNTDEEATVVPYSTEEGTAEPANENDAYEEENDSTDLNVNDGHEELPQDKDDAYEEQDGNIDVNIEDFAYGTNEAGEEPSHDNLDNDEELAYNADEDSAYTDDASEEPAYTDDAVEEPPFNTDDEQAYNADEVDSEPTYNTGDAEEEPDHKSDNVEEDPEYNADEATDHMDDGDEEPTYNNAEGGEEPTYTNDDEEPTYDNAHDGDEELPEGGDEEPTYTNDDEEPTYDNADDNDEEPTYNNADDGDELNADDGDEEAAYSNTDDGDEDPASNSNEET